MSGTVRLEIEIMVFDSEEELSGAERNLMAKAREAAELAYAPYSHFLVGAALLLEDRRLHTGNNQENAAYPSGLCAERTALFGLRCIDPEVKIHMIAVAARRQESPQFLPVTPCGSCRQVMAEYETRQESPIQLLMQGSNGRYYRFRSVQDLLPFQFTKTCLHLS